MEPVVEPVVEDHANLSEAVTALLPNNAPAYKTRRGAVWTGDALDLLAALPDESVDLAVTSPPYALEFKKEYGNEPHEKYVEWFRPFAEQVKRVLRPTGSFVVNIGGTWRKGHPVRSLYHFKLLIDLVDVVGFHLAQEIYWHDQAKIPSPAEWVTVRRVRVKDAVEPCWWLSKTEDPKASNRNVLIPYSPDMVRLIDKGFRSKKRPSAHHPRSSWQKDHGGAIPSNVLTMGNHDSAGRYMKLAAEHELKVHPARFPVQLPEWFIRMLTDEGDVVLDPFGGSMTTGWAAERLGRAWLGFELDAKYVEASKFRFYDKDERLLADHELGTPQKVVGNGHSNGATPAGPEFEELRLALFDALAEDAAEPG
jgi:DNA modification methylase